MKRRSIALLLTLVLGIGTAGFGAQSEERDDSIRTAQVRNDTNIIELQEEAEQDSSGSQENIVLEEVQKPEPEVSETPQSFLIEDFPIINQMPELPTGCEITAMTMAMQYYGCEVDKVTMAEQYLPVTSADTYYGADGRRYGSDMYSYFIGDPSTELGIICGPGAIVTAGNQYFSDNEMPLTAVDMTGTDLKELYRMVSQNQPVVVWVTISMADRNASQGWYTEDGRYLDWSTNDHGAVLIGYTEDTVTIADPISGLIDYDREQFEKVFQARGRQCVVIEKA